MEKGGRYLGEIGSVDRAGDKRPRGQGDTVDPKIGGGDEGKDFL